MNELREDDSLHLLEALVVVGRHKALVFLFPIVTAAAAVLGSFALPDIYTGTARILPPQQAGSPIAAALLENAAGLSGGLAAQALGLKNPSDLYAGMLESRSITDKLIHRFELQARYEQKTLVETRKALLDATTISVGRDGIITVQVDDRDPRRAAEMANAYVEELDHLTQNVSVSAAGRQRLVLEKQLKEVKGQLTDAELALRTTQEKTGLISVTEQGKATIESAASLRGLIAAKLVQLAAMRTSTTEANPEYVRVQSELSGLRTELAKLERKGDAGVIPSAGKIPEAGLEYLRKYRDVQYYQALFEVLAKQYEVAKAQEAADSGLIQVLDVAAPEDRKSKPKRALIGLLAGLLAGLAGLAGAFVLEARERARQDPARAGYLEELERAFSLRPSRRKRGVP